jgi:hypothetical protein
MRRVLYFVLEYPQISETYIKTEIDRVKRDFSVSVVAAGPADLAYSDHEPFEALKAVNQVTLSAAVRKYRPDIIHGHYFHLAPVLAFLAREAGTYFTVRTHSFDVLQPGKLQNANVIAAVKDAVCRGVLCFPFLADRLVSAGVPATKIVPCWPVVDVAKFRNRGPNGPDIMNVGAALPKKDMNLFVDLAKEFPTARFNLYMLGYNAAAIEAYAHATGSPVNVVPPVQPSNMPAEYKKHRWLVYTASKQLGTVGWPLSVAEAQASGVGVLVQNIRDDLADYVGPGGYVFDTIEDARRIISRPFPEEKREAGFLHAEKSDIDSHIDLLYRLWS